MKTVKINVTSNIIEASNLLVYNWNLENVTCACHCPISLALNIDTDYHGWFTTPFSS